MTNIPRRMNRDLNSNYIALSTALRLIKGEDVLIVGIAVFLAGSVGAGEWFPGSNLGFLFLACVFAMLGVAGVNSMNQIHDLKIDKVNKPLRPLPAHLLNKTQVEKISTGLLMTGVLLALILWVLVSPIFFIIGCLGLSTALLYSVPKIRLKKYPIISTAIMGFGYGPFLFIFGWVIYQPLESIPIWPLLFLYFHEVFILITKDYRDLEGDKKYQIRTLPTILGKRYAAIMNYILYVLPFIFLSISQYLGVLNHDFDLLLFSGILLGLPMFYCCSRKETIWNIYGYYIYIVAFIFVRVVVTFILI